MVAGALAPGRTAARMQMRLAHVLAGICREPAAGLAILDWRRGLLRGRRRQGGLGAALLRVGIGARGLGRRCGRARTRCAWLSRRRRLCLCRLFFGFRCLLQRLRRLRQFHPGAAVAIVTGNYGIDDATRAELSHLGAVVRYKPLWMTDMSSLVEALIAPAEPGAPRLSGSPS